MRVFGARITSAVDLSRLSGYAELSTAQRYERARGEDAEYLSRLCGGDPSCAYEVRWQIGADGPSLTVVGRLRRPDPEQADEAADVASRRILDTPGHVVAEPLHEDLIPFPPNGIAELRRHCVFAQPQRLDAGVRFYLAMPPMRSAPQAWPDLLDRLSGTPLVISTGLRPTFARPEFTSSLSSIADQYDRLAAASEFRSGGLYSAPRHLEADPFARTAAPLFRDAANRYRGWVFRLRVSVLTPGPLDGRLLDAVADVLGGVAERPATSADHAAAVDDLTSFEPLTWGEHPSVPPALRLLRHLADAGEAAAATWFPAAATGTSRGFPTTPPAADRTAGSGVVITDSTFTVEGDLYGGSKYGGT